MNDIINYLSGFVTPARLKRFEAVLANRTRHIAIGLENIYQTHNISAVLRSCDCFGIQDVYIIENENKFGFNPDISLGAEKWLTIHRFNESCNNVEKCVSQLKKRGYTIAVTSPHKKSQNIETYPIENIPLDNKLALFFGTEMRGATTELERKAEMFVTIPMRGFTESFNISVAAAISMYVLSSRLSSEKYYCELSELEKDEIRLQWLRNTIPRVELIEKNFRNGKH